MNRPISYLLLLIGTYIGVLSLNIHSNYRPVSYEEKGLQFTKLDKWDVILDPTKNDVIIIGNSAVQKVYKILNRYSGTRGMDLALYDPSTPINNDKHTIYQAINEQLTPVDTLTRLSYTDRLNMFKDGSEFFAMRLLRYTELSLFDILVDSPFGGMFTMALLFFVGLLFTDFIIRITNLITKKNTRLVIHIGIMLGAIILLLMGTTPESFAANKISGVFRVVFAILPPWFLLQFVLKNHVSKNDFAKAEFLKFTTLFLGACLSILIGTKLAQWIDQSVFESGPFTLLAGWDIRRIDIPFAFSFALGNFFNNLVKRWINLRSSEKSLEASQKQALASNAELNALHASINPHFLYNSLNSIASLARVDPPRTEKMAASLSSFYKYVTNRNDKHLCTVGEELEMIENYIKIEKVRFGPRLDFDLEHGSTVENELMPCFLLQPIVENAIKYGYDPTQDKIKVRILVFKEGKEIIMRVFDSGPPFKEQMNPGYGLKSVSKKLKLLFPDQHEFSFVNEPEKHVFIKIKTV